jgi:thiamine pyrophosphate-dependent acetolactate synthase large subunit-like protein
MKGSDLLVAALENEGVEQIFGVYLQANAEEI